MMKAIVHETYGSTEVLELKDIEQPTIGETDLLVRVRAASLNPYDWHLRTGMPYVFRLMFGLRKPKKQGAGSRPGRRGRSGRCRCHAVPARR